MAMELVTYAEATTAPAEAVVLVVRAKARVATTSGAYCSDQSSNVWFPVAPDTTLPSPPASTTNPTPAPPNSVLIPPGTDLSDNCFIFQDLLPISTAPVYATELEPDVVLPPYTEQIPLLGITLAALSVQEWPYVLTLPGDTVALVTRAVIQIPTYNLSLEAGALTLTGQDVGLGFTRRVIAGAGGFSLTGYDAGSVRNYVVSGGTGTFAVSGQDAAFIYQRLPMPLDAGDFVLTGQDSAGIKLIALGGEPTSFTLTGSDAGLLKSSYMTGAASTFTLTGQAAFFSDPKFSSVSLLLAMNGANNSTIFVDSSSNAFALTRNGTPSISTTEYKFGGASGYFDGNGDYLSRSYDAAFDLLGSDFTIELWVRPTQITSDRRLVSTGGGTVAYNGTNGIHVLLQINSNGTIGLQYAKSGGGSGASTTGTISINTWTHISACLSGTTIYLGINGVVSSHTIDPVSRPTTNPQIAIGTIPGEAGNSLFAFIGYMDDLRITKGYARYTSDFTPPVDPFTFVDASFGSVSLLLTMNSNFRDSSPYALAVTNNSSTISTSVFKYGGGSGLFNGTTSYLTVADGAAFQFGTGDFTIEAWINVSSIAASYSTIVGTGVSAFGNGAVYFMNIKRSSTTSYILFGINNGVTNLNAECTTNVTTGVWHHVAVTRSSSSVRVFFNGVLESTQTSSYSLNMSLNGLQIGRNGWDGAQGYWNGYIDDLRITKGIARYTSSFTPPAGPLPTS